MTTAAKPADTEVTALGLVDVLNDFGSDQHNNGAGVVAALPVPEGELIGPGVGRLQEKGNYAFTFAGNDKHRPGMFNFADVNPTLRPYVDQVADRNGKLWTVYPAHCLVGSWGAQYLPGVRVDLIDEEFPKGTELDIDSYSVCGNTDLVPRLRELGITRVDLVGLVFRICVGMSAIDLAKAGFKVRVIVDLTRDLDIPAFQSVIDEMKALGVELINLADVIGE